ncbi:hypothetical protein BDV37DRAFT_285893 [Aspergillus pseudonomiae]|uniref:PD-(D/E)XK nuclease-like domain-containing protein n=1 Tax=Aspergillus pseudonomiae TaxID=1506151 RepID=A0A5N7D5K8_9EURO|nr:uncharacterized protein BDV37DRAFT_285893 [Aspergillus pseudonomiae]KAE8401193.1 hypothetical protein BDV37DRAFT_285893 [Aspergillus pseudonomiae]
MEHNANDSIERWIDNVSTELQFSSTTSSNANREGQSWLDDVETATQPKRSYPDSPMAQSDPQKRPRRENSENVPPSVAPFRDDISLAPSLTQSTPSRRSSSPTRVKAQLATASPKVVFVHGSADPGCIEAKSLLGFLTSDDSTPWQASTDIVKKISSASSRCATELRSEGSWAIDVVRPLLEAAIDDLPLESWSVQTESVYSKYLPRYTAKDTFNRKIDLVVGLPKESWKEEYERVGIDAIGRDLSHIDHPHTGKRLLGLGVEVKPLGGNLIEAQVQLSVWMTGLMSWAYSSQHQGGTHVSPPPIVGCTVLGEDWKFYIIYGVAGASQQLSEVRVWGPFSVLEGQTMDERGVAALALRLRRVMQYIRTSYTEQLLSTISSSYSQ